MPAPPVLAGSMAEASGAGAFGLAGYVDACATTPPCDAALVTMAEAQRLAWANPSSLHGPGQAAEIGRAHV